MQGIVFQDENANGLQDNKEKGMQGVRISDGYQVVKTTTAGKFEIIPHSQARFLFVTVPSGYLASTAFYIPIDKSVSNYAFGMRSDNNQNSEQLDFIQITETGLYGTWVDNIKHYAKNQRLPLILHTGDICYEDGMKFHARHLNSDRLGTTINYAVGNHDLVKGKYGEELFEDLIGPTYYSFEKGPVHFVVTPMWSGDYAPSYTRDQVIRWLQKDLAQKDPSKALIFINHDFTPGEDFLLKGKTEEIDLKKYNLKAWLFGHWHNNYSFMDDMNGVHVISTNAPDKGGIDHAPGQFLHIQADKNGIKSVIPVCTNLNDYLELSEPIVQGAKVQQDAHVYDSERIIKEINMLGYNKQGDRLFQKELNRKGSSAWTWTCMIELQQAKEIQELLLEVIYQNGSTSLVKKDFNLVQRAKLPTLWSSNIGRGIWKVSPLLIDNKVIAATFDDTGSRKSKIVALDIDNGREIWSLKVKNSIKQKLHQYKNLILATDVEGRVYAIDSQTGTLQWTKSLRQVGLPNFVTGPELKDGVYYTGAGDFLTALNAENGQVIWRNNDWRGGEGMPVEMLATDELLLTGANWNALFVHDRHTGKLLWKRSNDGLRFRSSGVTVDGDEVYATGLDALFILSKADGAIIGQRKHNLDFKVMGSPLITESQFITGTSLNGVLSFNKETLEENWRFDIREALIFTSSYSNPNTSDHVGTVESSIVHIDDQLIFGASDGYLYILSEQGELLAEKKIGAPVLADPVIYGPRLFVADFAGNIHCIKYSDE